ncbi:hypothetical protein AVEN_104828-1 [Araneus ventricosus]|uniref:Uncharacterized protein n=1 Tax=Araneus ventricosus TaxID=182803 RepID=A0A4Y2QT62_ARAVE|nr:hypothetical protein AVEN_104828-1 [Araneus ventricosus]
MKCRVPTEVKEHFIDKWPKFKSPELLSEKLDQYESVWNGMKRKTASLNRETSILVTEKGIWHTLEGRQKKLTKVLSGRASTGVIIALPQNIFVLSTTEAIRKYSFCKLYLSNLQKRYFLISTF